MVDALASEVVDQQAYEDLQAFVLSRFPDDQLMQGYLCMRVFSAQLEHLMGIPFVKVEIDLESLKLEDEE
jgi:hypothetical protein